jgi:hypothetical protein
MRFKTLLLGSAAVLATAVGAQAADLSVAEPVDYVRVCDAFGEGYWYIPGTDTCIAISGKVESGIKWGDNFENAEGDDHDWGLYTRADVNVEAKSMTDWGPLTAFITLRSDYGSAENYDGYFYMDEAYLSLVPLLIGYTQSVFDVQGGGYTDAGLDLSDDSVNQIQLSWAFNGFGLAIGIEDPVDRYGSSADNIPHIAAALSSEFAGWDAAVSFLYAPNAEDDTIAVEGVVSGEFGIVELSVGAIWADGLGISNDMTNGPGGDGWSVAVSSQQNWQSNFYTAETFVWADWDNGTGDWGAAFTVGYSPVDSLWFIAGADTVDEGDSWDFTIYAEKTFGPNG